MKTIIIVNLTISCLSILLAAFITENPAFSLSRIHPLFNRKPFNCLPCLAFHLIWTLSGATALLMHSLLFFGTGLALAFASFFILKRLDKNIIDK